MSVMEILDDELVRLADRAYQREVAAWEGRLARQEEEFAAQLHDPQFATGLGLPAELPEFTINILKRTMAGDKLGDERPKRTNVYRRFGLSITD